MLDEPSRSLAVEGVAEVWKAVPARVLRMQCQLGHFG